MQLLTFYHVFGEKHLSKVTNFIKKAQKTQKTRSNSDLCSPPGLEIYYAHTVPTPTHL